MGSWVAIRFHQFLLFDFLLAEPDPEAAAVLVDELYGRRANCAQLTSQLMKLPSTADAQMRKQISVRMPEGDQKFFEEQPHAQ
jgi:hypothetical protein